MVLRAQLLLLLRLLLVVCITAPVLSQLHSPYGYGHIPYDVSLSPTYSHGGGGGASYGDTGGHENFVTPSSAIIYGNHGVGHGGPVYVEGGSTYGGGSYGGGGGGGGGVWKDDGPSYGGASYGGGGGSGGKGDGPYVGRVRIQVYRGPTQKAGYNKYWAPWGYFVTQPRDQPGGKGYGGGYGGYH